jgi:hypothetical protein
MGGRGANSKSQTTIKSKFQTPNPKQIPNSKSGMEGSTIVFENCTHVGRTVWNLKFGAYLDFGVWDLELHPVAHEFPLAPSPATSIVRPRTSPGRSGFRRDAELEFEIKGRLWLTNT